LNAKRSASSNTFDDGISPAMIRQNRHDMCGL
jgi:hypothetical protein